MATVKFGESELWKMPGVLIEEDKDFMQIIKKKDIKYQGDIQWMINNFYISKFVFIPDIYIFIKMLYNHNDGEDETIKAFKNLVNNVRIGEEPLETLITFILSAYILTYKDIEYYSETEEYQQLMDLESNVGIINYIINVDMGKLTYDSWGKHFFGDNILKNISLENYNITDGGELFESFTNTTLLTDDFGADFGVAEDCNFGIPDIFWEGSELNGYHLDTLLEQPNYRCSFFYKDDDNFFHIVFIDKGTLSVKYKDLIIYKKNSRVFGFIENLAFDTDDLSSDMSTGEFGDYAKMFYEGYQNFDKYNVLIGDEIENNWAMVINDIDFSINVRSNNYIELIQSSCLQYFDNENILGNINYKFYDSNYISFHEQFTRRYSGERSFDDITTYDAGNYELSFGKTTNGLFDDFYTDGLYLSVGENKKSTNSQINKVDLEVFSFIGLWMKPKNQTIQTDNGTQHIIMVVEERAVYSHTRSYVDRSDLKPVEYLPYNYQKLICFNLESGEIVNNQYFNQYYIENSNNPATQTADNIIYRDIFNLNMVAPGIQVGQILPIYNIFGKYFKLLSNFKIEIFSLKINNFYAIPEGFNDIKLLPKKILKKDDVKLSDQDITNVTIDGLDKSFHDWDNAPLYMIKTRYGKKDNSIVKSDFLEKTLNDIRKTNFTFLGSNVDEITPIGSTVEEDR